MNPSIYAFMEAASPYIVAWSAAFTLIILGRLAHRLRQSVARVPDSAAFTELAGLPLTLMQSVCFAWAVASLDWISALLFLWWGPGFIAIAVYYIRAKRRHARIDWHPVRNVISYLCKGCYIVYMAVFLFKGMPGMIFAFSAWIINDQCEKAFMSMDTDRLRRTFDDQWFFRIAYPAGLLTPLFAPQMPGRQLALAYGIVLLALWISGVAYVTREGLLRERPADPSLLRNMVYFPKLRQ